MSGALFRKYKSWRFLSLMAIIAILTMMGLLSVHSNQCSLLPAFNNKQDFTLPGVAVAERQPYWLYNFTNLENNLHHLQLSSDLQTTNLSKAGQEWFEILPDESYLQNFTEVFRKSLEIKSNFSEKFIINEATICVGNEPFLLVIIPSVADATEQRNAIRWTWLKAAEMNAWPRAFIPHKLKHIFLFGVREGKQSDDYKQLIEESQAFGDIVMADFVDTYRNLSRKIITGLLWARQYCKHAQFVLKTDQDTFINVPIMVEVLQHVQQKRTDSFMIGLQHTYNQPLVVRSGRWGVSKQEYPLDFYPKYLYGHAYVLNSKALFSITDIVRHVTLIAPEDAFITGILPKVAMVTRITAPSFTVCCRDIFDCEVVWNQKVALPEIKSEKLLAQLWANIITHSCNNSSPFIK